MYVPASAHHPAPVRVADTPGLWIVDDFLPDEDIEAVLALFGDQAFVAEAADHYGWDESGFVGEVPADCHPLLARVMARIEAAVGRRSSRTPTLRFRYYDEGQGHPPHVDAYPDGDTRLGISTLVTLVEAEEGGETRFPRARPEPVEVAGRRGRLVAWTSTLPGGADDPASLHDGAPVVRGAKGVLLGFLYLPLAEAHGVLELSRPPDAG